MSIHQLRAAISARVPYLAVAALLGLFAQHGSFLPDRTTTTPYRWGAALAAIVVGAAAITLHPRVRIVAGAVSIAWFVAWAVNLVGSDSASPYAVCVNLTLAVLVGYSWGLPPRRERPTTCDP